MGLDKRYKERKEGERGATRGGGKSKKSKKKG
jgi:hypothetical protein